MYARSRALSGAAVPGACARAGGIFFKLHTPCERLPSRILSCIAAGVRAFHAARRPRPYTRTAELDTLLTEGRGIRA